MNSREFLGFVSVSCSGGSDDIEFSGMSEPDD